MYKIINTYPRTSEESGKEIKIYAAKIIYEELIRYLAQKNSGRERNAEAFPKE